ncbi:CU044_5270 family protein [Streptomyces sp. BE20]|uniref:CU044_5270 family protein n=1 Tax=Streptomyces sp. BE20 TaxID=3002525 RepID=UPI002E7735F0|nr:CU044_5270 family protein [Streptomyces sp. BE20]MEE1827487.1 CU044_5270 family protein [Streptomyces sp. BE20]
MNTASTDHDRWDEHGERRELARLLPPPPHPVPSLDQMAARREFLLDEFDRSRPFAALTSRWRGLALVAAVGTAATLMAVTLTQGTGASTNRTPPATAASVELLDRAARVAWSGPEPSVRDAQYTYLRTVSHSTSLSESADGTMRRGTTTTEAEKWASVDGSRPGLTRHAGADEPLSALDGSLLTSSSYRLLATLPTDPELLLRKIHADAVRDHGRGSDSTTGPDQESFVAIGDLLRSTVVPPRLSAALYRAAARIPGVVAVDDAVDAAGRRGVAVARVHNGERFEWIFDRQTMCLLGTRTVLIKDGPWGKSGDEVDSAALVAWGIVDTPGEAAPQEATP